MLRYDTKSKKVTEHRELCDTQVRIVEIIQDAAGEILFVDFAGGGLHRLMPSPPPKSDAPQFPRKLSETGLFANVKDHKPAAGVIPYDVVAPLWSDGAIKDRFMAVPGDAKIEFDAVTYPAQAPGNMPGWRFPDGTVFVKTFSLETEPGNPKSVRRLETRLLHHIKMPGNDDEYGAQVWNGYTYVWNDEQTDAELLDAKGLDRVFKIKDKSAPNGVREQKWHFPSRARMRVVSHDGGEVCARRDDRAVESRLRFRRRQAEEPVEASRRTRLLHEADPLRRNGTGESARRLPRLETNAGCPRDRTCMRTVRTVIASGVAAMRSSFCSRHCHSRKPARSASVRDKVCSNCPIRKSSSPAIRPARWFCIG